MAFLSNIQYLFNGVDIDDLMQEINSLKKEIFSAKKEISRYSTSLTEKNNEIASLKQLNVSLSEDMTRERNKYSILKGKADDLNKTIAELKKENEIFGTSEQKFKVECERTTKSNASLNGKNLALTNKVKALEEKITQLESIQLRQQSELSEKNTKISMMGANYDKLQSDYNNNKEQLEEANRTIEGEKSAKKGLEEYLAQLQEENRILSEKSDSLQVAVDELASENSRLREDSTKANEKIDFLTKESSSKESEKSALREELDKQKTENDSLKQQIQELVAEKAGLSPYMYLVEAKKEQEAIESAIKEARKNLQNSLDSAMYILSTIKHDEVKNSLEDAIKSSHELVNSADCTLEELNNSKDSIDSAAKVAEEHEINLIEQEEAERKRKEQEEAERLLREKEEERKRKEQEEAERLRREEEEEKKRQKEENRRKEQELKNDLGRLIDTAKSFCNTVSYDDISMSLQAVIDNTEMFIKVGLFEYNTLENNYTTLKNALDVAKKEVESAKKTESHIVKRSILEIFDTKEGDIIDSESFFKRPEHELIRWRRIFEESILAGEHRFICTNCRQDVKISGRKYERGQVAFFSHLHDSDYCEIKTTTGLSKEQIEARKYGLVAESDRHKRLKRLIHEALEGYASRKKGVADIVEEKRVYSNLPYMNWRKPDVIAKYNNLNIVFELQLSTTFISVVVQRDIFYRLNDFFIIWVFNFDNNQKYVDLTNLMCKDIYYANKRNVFIFDAEAQQASEEKEELVLKCNWLDTDNTWHYSPTKGNGDGILITIDELKYDKETAKPYYFDAETPYYEIHPEVKERIQKEERSKQQMIDDLLARASREAEEAIVKRDNALKLMLENDGHVSPFKEGNKYGFKYNNVVLVPAKYSSYSEFGNNGMYKVSFNRHHGLIDKYGNELFACDYLDFHRLSNGLIVAESTSGFFISGIGRISERSPHDTISLRELSPELFVILHNSNSLDVFIVDDEYLFKKNANDYAFYSITGEQLIANTFSKYHFTQGYSALWLQNSISRKWKVTELDGSEKNSLEYIDCNFEQERTIAIQLGNTDVYNSKGEIIRSTDYDNIKSFELKEYSKVIKGDKCGLIDGDFSEKLSVEYEEILPHKNFILAKKGGFWAILDENCSLLSSFEFDSISDFYTWYSSLWANWLLVKRDGLEGLYNSDGHCVLKAEYESIDDTDKELLIVKRNGKYGLYNKEGEKLIDPQYDKIKSLPNGVNVIVCIEEKSYIYCILDKRLDKRPYASIRQLDENYLVVQSGESYGLSNTHGEVRIPISFQGIDKLKKEYSEYHPSIFRCDLNGKVGAYSIIDKRIVLATEFDNIEWWNQNVFKVKKGFKWGLYEIGKGYLTEIKYDSISPYNNTKITVSFNLREGHISPIGEEICSESIELSDGYETKKFFSRWSLFKDSKMIIPYEHDDPIEIIDDNLFKVKTDGKLGIKDSTNSYIFQPQYRDIVTIDNCNFAIVKLIKYRKERKSESYRTYSYKWRTTYHTVDVEYNEFQLYNIDGTQNGIPSKFCGTYSNIEFASSKFIWLDKHILSLDNFVITEDTYSSFEPFKCDGFVKVKKEKYGILNFDLKLILPCDYDSIQLWDNDLFLTRNDIREGRWYDYSTREEYRLYKKDGVICSIGVFEAYEDVGEGKTKIIKNSQIGYINQDGEIIYDDTETMNNEIVVSKAFGHVEIKSIEGDILVPLSEGVTETRPFVETFYIIVKEGKQGVLNVRDKKYIKCEFDSIELWSKGILLVSKNHYYSNPSKTYGLLSVGGESITTKEYTKISSLVDGFADAERNGITGKLDDRGHEVYDIEEPLNDRLIKRRFFGKWEVFNKNEHQILPSQWDNITLFTDSIILASVTKQVSTSSYYSTSNLITSYMLFTLDGNKVLPDEFSNINKCSNECCVVTKNSYDSLLSKNFDVLIPFEKSYQSIREWSENKYVARSGDMFVVISERGEVMSKNKYSKIGDLIDGKAEVVSNYKTGYINQDCEELSVVTDTRGNWSISKFFGNYSILKNGNTILSDLLKATFLNDSLIKIKKITNYSLFSTILGKELPTLYKGIGHFNGSLATVVNLNNVKGAIDEEGNECYDHMIELGGTIIAKRKFSRYEVFRDNKILLSNIIDVSKWDEGKLRVTINANKVQIFSINENKYLGDWYNSISDIEEGKARVKKNASEGYIDTKADVIPTKEICIEPNVHKVQKLGLWYIVDDNNKQIIDGSFKEIGSYKGKFIKFDDYDYSLLDYECSKVVPVWGSYYKNNTSTLIYLVGGHHVRVYKKTLDLDGKNVLDFIKENKTLKLGICSINKKNHAVYAKPYKEMQAKMDLPPFDIGQIVEGVICKIKPFGIIIKCKDGRKTLIHISRLQEMGYGDYKFELSQPITIKKIGFNEEYNKDIWEILFV